MRSSVSGACCVLLAVALAGPVHAQGALEEAGGSPASSSAVRSGVPVLTAGRIVGAEPRIDGNLDEAAWGTSSVARDFVQFEPIEGALPSQRTEARVLYGADALYVGIRAYDSAPDSIVGQLTRRDQESYSDRLAVVVDSYHDRRTAFHFEVNPRGVKTDIYRFDDTQQDRTWDAVWDVAASVDEHGWTAEFRIPLSQLRFRGADRQSWGINFTREIARHRETSAWAPLSNREAGMVSRAGELSGLVELQSPRRLEVIPYSVAEVRSLQGDPADPFYRSTYAQGSVGGDLKYGLTGDLTLDVTVNPDFGQVEADPAEVNLTAFESFFSERRPFFVEGSNFYNFGIGLGDGDGAGEALFYSRRIGRAPQGSPEVQGGFADVPELTSILGAAKVSGKTSSGWSVGLLSALTGEEKARVHTGEGERFEDVVEPATAYGVARIQRDFRDGKSAVGFIGTGVVRDAGVAGALGLRSNAVTGGLDFRHRFGSDRFQVSGYAVGSRVSGSPEAIEATQRSSSRYFQRPDAEHVDLDADRTSLDGWAGFLQASKIGGGFWRFSTGAQVRSPGFEPNDVGFMREADFVTSWAWAGYHRSEPSGIFRNYYLNANAWTSYTFGGEQTSLAGNVNGSFTLNNNWGGWLGVMRQTSALSTGALRGGPALLREAGWNGWSGLHSDTRNSVSFSVGGHWGVRPESDSWNVGTNAHVGWRPSGRTSLSVGPFVSWRADDRQWVERLDLTTPEYVIGRLDQTTVGITARVNYAFTPTLSLQVYAQPFVSAGSYAAFKRVDDPRAARYADRFGLLDYVADPDGGYLADVDGDGTLNRFDNPDFNSKQFQSNVVLRWEYRPGSAVYLVWTQARDHWVDDGSFQVGDDANRLFAQPPNNVLLLKVSYWLST